MALDSISLVQCYPFWLILFFSLKGEDFLRILCTEIECVFVFQAAVSMLKQDYKEGEMTLSAALALAVKVLNKTMDVSKLSAEKGVCVFGMSE